MDRRIRAAALTVAAIVGATAGVILHARTPSAEAAMSPFDRLIVDSAAADAAAFAGLPKGLSELLDIRHEMTPEGLESLPSAECVVMEPNRQGELRRRLNLRLADSASVVLYATADDSSGTLARVEFIRRTPRKGQRGLIWEAERDHTQSMWWTEPERGVRRRVDRGNIPRGGPVPRALRALGRRLITLPCEEEARTRR